MERSHSMPEIILQAGCPEELMTKLGELQIDGNSPPKAIIDG